MMRRLALPAALLLAIAIAHPASSQEHEGEHAAGHGSALTSTATAKATIGFDSVAPARLDLVTGESVTWTNESSRVHTVTADDDSYDSGRLISSETYTHRFTTPGVSPYHCSLHPLINGVVATHDLLLASPAGHASSGKPFPLVGRSALAPGTPVTIEADAGTGFAPVLQTEIGEEGAFAVRVAPKASATYRAVGGGATSPPVQLHVENHRIAVSVQRMRGGHVRLRATLTPRPPGGRLVLQLFLPERFGWWPVRQATVGKRSTATFDVHTARRLRARVRYTLADGATTLATSRIVRVGTTPRASPPAHDHG
jgi:plastocyanin